MIKWTHAVAVVGAALAACMLVPLAGSAAGPPDVTCNDAFAGMAHDLTVPEGATCIVTDATITHDVIVLEGGGAALIGTRIGHDVSFADDAGAFISGSSVGHDVVADGTGSGADVIGSTVNHNLIARGEESGFGVSESTVGHDVLLLGLGGDIHMGLTTIGHDFFASKPQTVQTSRLGRDSPEGPVNVGHDFTIEGSPDFPFVFDGLCDLHVTNDLRITDRTVNLGIGLGAQCAGNGAPANTIGRDLVVTGNEALSGVFGPSSIRVGANHVGRDLVFADNTAGPGGQLEVSGNTVGRDASCTANTPAVTVNAPNTAGRTNTCG